MISAVLLGADDYSKSEVMAKPSLCHVAPAALTSAAFTAALLAGCVSYAPAELARLSTIELCELRETQSFNLSATSKAAMQNELQRRNENCAAYRALLAERREAALYREMYGKHDDP